MKKGFYLSGLLAVCFLLSSVAVRAAVPVVTTNPHDTTVCMGITATFHVAATGGSLTFKWQESTDGTTWANLRDTLNYSGTSTSTLSIVSDTLLTGRWYRALVTNTDGADTSSNGKLTVNPQPYAGGITGASSLCMGSTTALSDSIAGGVWSVHHRTIDTIDASGVVYGVSHGFDTIKYKYTNVCGSDSTWAAIRIDTAVIAAPVAGPTAVCRGANITLTNAMTANVLGSGAWSATNGSATVTSSGIVHGASYGLDSVYYTFVNACGVYTATTTVQVDTVLAHGTISGTSTVCAGSWVHLTPSHPGGIWMSDDNSVSVVDASGNVTGISQGTATISYYFTNACGASVATYTVSVARTASAITGGDSVGIGATLALSDSAINGTGAWSISNAKATINSTTGLVTGVATGTATVTFTMTNACGTSHAYLTLHVGDAPALSAIAGKDSVCTGSAITLSDNLPGGVWAVTNGHATISASGVLTGVSLGFDTVSYTVTDAFGTTTVTKKVYVNHAPTVNLYGPNILSLGGNYFIYGYPQGGTFSSVGGSPLGQVVAVFNGTYTFHKVADGTDSATIQVTICSYVVTGYGSDVVTYHRKNTCGTTDSLYHLELTPVAVNTVNSNVSMVNVYPDPNQGEFSLNITTAAKENAKVIITNMLGTVVKQMEVPTNNITSIQLDQPAGIYLLSAETSEGRYTAKVTVNK